MGILRYGSHAPRAQPARRFQRGARRGMAMESGLEQYHLKATVDTENKVVAPKILSCGIVPVRYAAGGWKLLILRAFKNWDFPKGIVEPNEDPLDAAKREVEEETSITDLEFVFGEDFKETVPYANN